jgi:CPA2 family monovalent cation:H+ antiporter-2
MEGPAFLEELLVLVGASALVAYVSQRLRIAPAAGFLLAGVVIGPNALGLVRSTELVEAAAELGVMLLLFTIGIEFSLENLSRIRRAVFLGGSLQVVVTVLLVAGALAALGVSLGDAVFTGFLAALSSTAIVLKLLTDRGEMRSRAGETALGILVFQDLAVLAMMLLVPALAGKGGAVEVAVALGKAALFVAVVVLVARRVMPRLLEAVARTCSAEVFVLTVLGICIGSAYLFSRVGLSLSLGAFLAGLLVSESAWSGHALGEILPFKILFTAAFFVSIGLLVDARFVLDHAGLIALLLVAVVVWKTLAATVAVAALGQPVLFGAAVGVLIAQVGEFSFVLNGAGRAVGLRPGGLESGGQMFIAVTVLLMIASPGLAELSRWIQRRAAAKRLQGPAVAAGALAWFAGAGRRDRSRSGHVILAGYGSVARRLVPVLASAGAEAVVTTLSPEGAREAEALGLTVLRGDYGRRHVLEEAGLGGAAAMVVADDDLERARAVTSVARRLEPAATIVARAGHAAEAEALHAAGAHAVVADETEAAAAIARRVLETLGVGAERSDGLVAELRAVAYRTSLGGARSGVALRDRFELTSQERQSKRCRHAGEGAVVAPRSQGCEECLRDGSQWVHLRVCMSCGHVGCCDSSPRRHARAHWETSRHPLMKSAEPGEDWAWCYIDEVVL